MNAIKSKAAPPRPIVRPRMRGTLGPFFSPSLSSSSEIGFRSPPMTVIEEEATGIPSMRLPVANPFIRLLYWVVASSDPDSAVVDTEPATVIVPAVGTQLKAIFLRHQQFGFTSKWRSSCCYPQWDPRGRRWRPNISSRSSPMSSTESLRSWSWKWSHISIPPNNILRCRCHSSRGRWCRWDREIDICYIAPLRKLPIEEPKRTQGHSSTQKSQKNMWLLLQGKQSKCWFRSNRTHLDRQCIDSKSQQNILHNFQQCI